jgi:hypothetical protein
MTTRDSQSRAVTRDDLQRTTASHTSAAQRQSAYRQRRKRAVIDAIGNEAAASRATLLALLAHELAALEDQAASAITIGPARNTARRVLNEIITRYAIDL